MDKQQSTWKSSNKTAGHTALRKGRVLLAGQLYLITAVTRQRHPWFLDFSTACMAARCFENSTLLEGSRMLAWVLMPDHAHWLIQLGGNRSLSGLVNCLKSASARQANCLLQRSGPLWAAAYQDRALRREEDVKVVARYIIANPLRAGLVAQIGNYPFWNASWL